ncbi:MAG: hypothetical protein ILP13_04460, partial [Lachnospiraceae bacterium]|nr:hypothetical protein [Lachnospiraceae bacterium]
MEKAPAVTADGTVNETDEKLDEEPGTEEPAEVPVAEDPAEEPVPTYGIELSVSQGALDGDGNELLASVTVSYSEGSIPSEAVGKYVVYVYAGTGKKYEKLTADGAISFKSLTIKGGNTYDVYA